MKNKTGAIKSSEKVRNFLAENNLHKKDFAQMIGVTLSYVYNLIDDSIPFSTRATTIERIATVMDIMPEDFEEYVIEDDPIPFNKNLEEVKNYIKKNKLNVVDFLKLFERKKRLKTVDMLRGAEALPINLEELKTIKEALNMKNEDFFELWKNILTEYLDKGGFESEKNKEITEAMFAGAKKYF